MHGLLLAVIAVGAFATTGRTAGGPVIASFAAAMLDTPTWVDLAAADILAPLDVAVSPVPISTSDPAMARPADQSRAESKTPAPAAAGGPDRRTPAPDRGSGRGKPVEDPAWRRDATSLHERLSDGAEGYQPSRAKTGPRALSPQAVRRELRTGLGDSAQTRQAQHAPPSARYGVAEPNQPGAGAATMDGVPDATPVVPVNDAVSQTQVTVLASSQGPLDVQRGTRSFDVEASGPTPSDDRVLREASHEDHPGITDLSLAAVSGNTDRGRGPSDTPGAVPRITEGTAPSPAGHRGAATGTAADPRTEERRYDRYKQEIGDRVEKQRVFPRSLAVQLQQGETLLHFVVRPDGKLGDAIQIVKSSGFAEFDQAAVDAVRKALPFRPMPNPGYARPLGVTLRVAFPNPVIR
jgi:TonB family protein